MNSELLSKFMDLMHGKDVLEMGLKGKVLNELKKLCNIHSFDITTSPLKFDKNSAFKQNALVRLPFKDGQFDGLISYKIIGHGESEFLFNEMHRVAKDIIMICEDDLESLPLDYFMTLNDMFVDSVSVDDRTTEINENFEEFFSRRDLKRIFYKPGGNLGFNLLIPEDIPDEIILLCRKTS